MNRSARHASNRLRLVPHAYLEVPQGFGAYPRPVMQVPRGGDEMSRQVAEQQHRLVRRWRAQDGTSTQVALARRYGIGRRLLADVLSGRRWICPVTLAALLSDLAEL